MPLKDIYNNFSSYLTKKNPLGITKEINEDPERLTIYSNNILASKVDSITASYPAVKAIVGDEFFKQFATKYAKGKQSNSGSLDEYARTFPSFIKDNFNLHQLKYLNDIALFESNCDLIDQYDGHEETLNISYLTEEKLMQLQLNLKENCTIQTSNFPILSLYLFTKDQLSSPPNLAKPETTLIYKDKFDIRFLEINKSERDFLMKFNGAHTLYEIFTTHEESFQSLLQKFLFCLTDKQAK